MKQIATLAAAGCLVAMQAAGQAETEAQADFVDLAGDVIGSATLMGTPQGVLIDMEVTGLPSGQQIALHAHEVGECNPANGFDSAEGHFAPEDRDHGYLADGGPHAGDMPNQYVGTDGVLRAQVFNSFVTLDEGEAGIIGRALILHDGPDDYQAQPAGDAGDRIACAVIQ